MTTQDTIEKYVAELRDWGWETYRHVGGDNAFTSAQVKKITSTLTAVAEEARREERVNLVEWMTKAKGVYSAHDVRMSFISYINALNDREDNTK